jgi:hypothetical protein
LENLAIISKAEKVKLSQLKLRSDNREITLAGVAVVKHLLAIHSRLNKKIGSKEHKLFINRESKRRIREKNRYDQKGRLQIGNHK